MFVYCAQQKRNIPDVACTACHYVHRLGVTSREHDSPKHLVHVDALLEELDTPSVVALASISANHLSGSSSLAQCSSLNGRALKLGVKYEVSAALTVQTLNATFGQYLSNFMKRYGCQGGVEMVPYSHAQMQTELTNSLTNPDQASVDVAFVSPGIVAGFHRLYPDITVLATVRDLHLRLVSSYLAGVLTGLERCLGRYVYKDGLDKREFGSWQAPWRICTRKLADGSGCYSFLARVGMSWCAKRIGKKLCSLATDSFSGFQIQQLESMLRTGKRLEDIFTGGITRCSSHDEVLESANNCSCHVGTVETGVLERVNNSVSEISGLRIPIDTWAIIGEEIAGQGNSTRPYPEWGVIALPHLSAELASRVQAGLIGMDEHSDAAAIGNHAGFDFPEDYTEVVLVEYHLDFFGNGRCPPYYQRGQTGLRLCDPCPAGSYSPNDVTPCLLCPPRYYNSEPGAASCLRCAQGYSTFQDGSLHVCHTRSFTKAVENKTIHFGFLDPGLYNIMKYRYQMEAIAAVLRYYQGSATSRMDSFTGYQIQWFSFFNQEIDLNSVFKTIKFSNSHEESVRMVMDGECDVGMASTNTLEEMSRKNTYTLSDFTIINEQIYSNFQLKVSTPLYSEWPLAVMPGVPKEISKLILIPLLHILDDDIAAIAGKRLGFQTTFDFSKSQNVIFQLNLMNPATSACKPGWERDYKPRCKECDAGRYSFDGIDACRLCSPGFANPDQGKTQCQRCPEGQQVEVSASFTISRWSPTFEETLNTYMSRFKCFFQMKSMRLEELAVVVKNGSVQFAFTDSGVYAQYKHRYQTKAIATVVRYYDGRAYKRQGGVMFRLTNKNSDIFNLSQITKEQNLTGWNVQRYEFFEQFLGWNAGQRRLTYYPARQFHSGFNLQSSSALYSEWVFTVMNGVPEDVSSNAIIPLLGMREFDAASKTGLHAGFVPPRNYAAEENVYFDLDLMNNETHVCAPGRERDNTKLLKPCKECDAGRYSVDGIGACRPCSPGFANNLTGQTQCQRCPEGQATYNFGELQCQPEQDRLLYDPIVGCSGYVNNTLTVGMQQAELSASFTINLWSPTFEETLNAYMNRFKCFFQMKSMRLEELAVAVKNDSVQFAFVDSGVYALYKQRYQAKALATMVRYYDGRAYKRQGGVMFRLTRNHTDIFNLSQITKERNLTAWCACKFARTYSIRILINNGIYPADTFTLINEQFHSGFILQSSSALYSEWAFTVMNGVPEDVSSNAIIPLLGMREFDAASKTGLHAGFIPPRNYARMFTSTWI
eukprot:g59114.t1